MFGQRLKELRKEKKLTSKQLGERFNLAESTISGYETGARKPDIELIRSFAKFFEVTTDYLLGESDIKTQNTVNVAGLEVKLSPDELRIFEELKKHPVLFHDLATNPEKKVKELIKLYKMKKMFLEDDDEEYGEGFGDIED